MARTFCAQLQALTPQDLETLLQRRPETRRLLGTRTRRDFATLADTLSRPEAVQSAAASLSAFLTQLLQLALWLGPEVTLEALAEQAPGVALEDLRQGAQELTRWGLAFLVERGPRTGGTRTWALQIPPSTAAAITMPAGLGPLARRVLEDRSPGFLTAVAANIGLAPRPHSGQETMAGEIAAALSEPPRVRALLADAPPKSLTLFELIRSAGSVTRHELMTGGQVRWSDPPWSERRKVMTPLDWLESRGLVVFDGLTHYAGVIVVPAEAELALRGGRIFAAWPSPAPPALTLPPVAGRDVAGGGDPSQILAELEAVLEEWAQTRPASLQRGGLGVRELRKTAKALGFPERYVSFLYALAVEAVLIGLDPDGRVVPSPQALAWAKQPAPQRWARLFEAWQACRLWIEQEGLVGLDKVGEQRWVPRLRASVLEELAALPPEAHTDARLLGARIYWRQPELIHCEDCAHGHVAAVVESLLWLGTVAGPSPIRLLEPGRSAVADPEWFTGHGPAAQAFATEVASCTVGADLNIIVPGPPIHELGWALSRFADLKASSPARIYRLSEGSLRRALDNGMQAGEILSVLERHAPRGVPQNVAYLIEDVGRRHGHLVAGEAGLYLRSDDPGLLRAAIADRRLSSFRPRQIAPTVAILHGVSVEALLVALRGAGYFPVAEDGGGILRGRAPLMHATPMLDPVRSHGPLSRAEAVKLAEAIRNSGNPEELKTANPKAPRGPTHQRGPAVGPGLIDGRVLDNRRDIAALIEVAIDEQRVVEIAYVSATGRDTVRSIEPLNLSGGMVDAWCRLRDDGRNFVLANIQWARATGERFSEGEPTNEEIHTL